MRQEYRHIYWEHVKINCFSNGPGSVVGIATGYRLDGPGIEPRWGGRDFPHLSTPELGAHPASCTMGTGSFPGVKSGRGVTLTPHPLLVPWSWKSTAIPLLPLWAVRPVQSLSACTMVNITFFKMIFQGNNGYARKPQCYVYTCIACLFIFHPSSTIIVHIHHQSIGVTFVYSNEWLSY